MFIKNFICLVGLLLCVNSNAQIIEELGVFPEDYSQSSFVSSELYQTKDDSLILSFYSVFSFPSYFVNYIYRDGVWEVWSETLISDYIHRISIEFDKDETAFYVTTNLDDGEVQLLRFDNLGYTQIGQSLEADYISNAYTVIDTITDEMHLYLYRNDSVVEYNYNSSLDTWEISLSKAGIRTLYSSRNDNSYVFDRYNDLPIFMFHTGGWNSQFFYRNSTNFFSFGPVFERKYRYYLEFNTSDNSIYIFFGNTTIKKINCPTFTIEDIYNFSMDGVVDDDVIYEDVTTPFIYDQENNFVYYLTDRRHAAGTSVTFNSSELFIYDMENEILSGSTFNDSIYINRMILSDNGDIYALGYKIFQASPTSISTKTPAVFKISNIYLNQESKEIKEPSIFIQNKFDSYDIQTENNCELRVYGLNGTLLQSYSSSINFTLDKSNFVPGMYLLRFDFEDNTSTTRKVVMN